MLAYDAEGRLCRTTLAGAVTDMIFGDNAAQMVAFLKRFLSYAAVLTLMASCYGVQVGGSAAAADPLDERIKELIFILPQDAKTQFYVVKETLIYSEHV